MKAFVKDIQVTHGGKNGLFSSSLPPQAEARVLLDDFDWADINEIADSLLGVIDYFPPKAVVKCQYCGQWAAKKCACKHCGGTV